MKDSPLLKAHHRMLIAKRLYERAAMTVAPGVEASFRRLARANHVLEVARERYRQTTQQIARPPVP